MKLTNAALDNLLECGVDIAEDIRKVKNGAISREVLLEICLCGADPDREEGWRDYVGWLMEQA